MLRRVARLVVEAWVVPAIIAAGLIGFSLGALTNGALVASGQSLTSAFA